MTAIVALGLLLAADAAAPAKNDVPAPAKKTATAAATKTSPGKLAPEVAKEMADAIVAVNKALGLESWPAQGVKPCIDRGGQGVLSKNVTPEQKTRCAAAAVEKGLPGLGKSYVL